MAWSFSFLRFVYTISSLIITFKLFRIWLRANDTIEYSNYFWLWSLPNDTWRLTHLAVMYTALYMSICILLVVQQCIDVYILTYIRYTAVYITVGCIRIASSMHCMDDISISIFIYVSI